MTSHCITASISVLLATSAFCATPITPNSVKLERTFWVCDYVATRHGIDAAPSECSAAYAQIKDTMFGGDLERMLDWWRQHKPVEHANVANSIMNASTSQK